MTRLSGRGLRVATPDVVTWPELLRRQFDARPRARAAPRPLACRRLTHASSGSRLVRAATRQLRRCAPAGLGEVAYRSWTLLHQYRIPYTALARPKAPRWQLSPSGSSSTAAGCERATGSIRRWRRPSSVRLRTDVRLISRGFDRWTPEQATFVAQLRAGSRSSLPSARVRPAGRTRRSLARGGRMQRLRCRTRDRRTLGGALRCSIIRKRASRWSCRRSIASAPRVRRELDRVLAPAGGGLTGGPAPESRRTNSRRRDRCSNDPSSRPHWRGSTPARHRGTCATLSALLLGPHDGAAATEAHAARGARRRTAAHGPAACAGSARSRDEARRFGCQATAAAARAATVRAQGVDRPAPAEPMGAGIRGPAARTSAGPAPTRRSRNTRPSQRWQALLGDSAPATTSPARCVARAALGHLRELAADTAFEPQEIAAPLLVIDPETALGMHFDALWICGLDAARWPAPASPDPFLPRDGRRASACRARRPSCPRQARVARCSDCRAQHRCRLQRAALRGRSAAAAECAGRRPAAQRRHSTSGAARIATRALFEARPALETLLDGTLPAFAAHEVVQGRHAPARTAGARVRSARRSSCGSADANSKSPQPASRRPNAAQLAHAVLQAFWNEVRGPGDARSPCRARNARALRARLRHAHARAVACDGRRRAAAAARSRTTLARGTRARIARARSRARAVLGRAHRGCSVSSTSAACRCG